MKPISKNNTTNASKIVLSLSLITILCVSTFIGILPLIGTLINEVNPTPNPKDEISTVLPIIPTIAGEPNFTREGFAFVMNNYPDFNWKDPGASFGTGAEAYPTIYNELNGLNESNIRIAYLNADYEWVIVPFQIDNIGWPNVWQVQDLNHWHGIDAPLVGWTGFDPTPGLGWINGDPAGSCGDSGQDGQIRWYPTPIHTFVTTKQPDGSYTSETVNIDSGGVGRLANDLVSVYNGGITSYPATGYQGQAQEAWIRLVTEPAVPSVANTVFIGDTWYKDPTTCGVAAIEAAFNYQQIPGALDKDDELAFYAYPGRQAPTYLWWNAPQFPSRLEFQIVDPVDGGLAWMYIYYNNDMAYNPILNATAINLGAPEYTTEVHDYTSWDPDSLTISTDFYQISTKEGNPSQLDSAKMLRDSDGQNILTQFNKMYGYGSYDAMGLLSGALSAGREGTWYAWDSASSQSHSELVCTLDNPSVWYPNMPEDTNNPSRTAVTSPQYYYGPQAVAYGHTPYFDGWEQYGDGRAIIDGDVRVIMYLQQYLTTGIHALLTGSPSLDERIDVFTSIMDGPQYYYSRMQLAPPAVTAMPYLSADIVIEINYVYIMSGNIDLTNRGDFNLTAAQEWTGGTDNVDDGVPTFGYANGYGYAKMGGDADPKQATYTILGSSITDGNDGAGDYYASQGDPVWGYVSTVPPGGISGTGAGATYTGNALEADWFMITSETHGGIFVYVPRREILEIRDNYRGIDRHSPTAIPKMYFRDDSRQAEFGICLDGGATTVRGGSSTSPYSFMMVYGDFTDADVAQGHKLYLQYYFPLSGISTFNSQTAPPSFHYDTVQPDALAYRRTDTITLTASGDRDDAVIMVDFSDIDAGAPLQQMTNNGGGFYSTTYTIADVAHGTNYERDIILNATVPSEPGWDDALYTLTISIDDVAPSPGASLATLSSPTQEAVVFLDWHANVGHDEGSASVANPTGIDHYRIRRGASGGPYNNIIADNIPYDPSFASYIFQDTFIENSQTYGWVIDAYDAVGNFATSGQVWTLIDLPYTPAQPDTLPATTDAGASITIDWTANPGYGSGVTITGYELWRSTQVDTGYAQVWTGAATSRPDPFAWVEATTYYWKVRTMTSGTDLYSAPVYTKIDRVNPQAAELATPFPIYYSQTQDIVVSWAIESLPQYSSGGFPGHDLNGVHHWLIEKNAGAGWTTLGTVSYGPDTADQQILDTSVLNGGTYSYRITTYDAAGNSATGLYVKTTQLQVVGDAQAEVFSVTAGTAEVTQGDTSIPVTVIVRNPGLGTVDLDLLSLTFEHDSTDVTADYSNIVWAPGGTYNIAQFTNISHTFYVDVGSGATLGTIDIDAETIYDGSETDVGGIFTDSWLVKPDADLVAVSVSSTYNVVHPGENNIPVNVLVRNPGSTNAILETVELTFMRDTTDISNKFMVEYITALPSSGFTGDLLVQLRVTVGVSITAGGVTIDAIVSGNAAGVPLSDDGADTTKSWAVVTWPVPVIASIEADKEVYWQEQIVLIVTCDNSGYSPVRADMSAIDGGAGWVNAQIDFGDGSYSITHTIANPGAIGEGIHTVTVEATNATSAATDTRTIDIRLGQAPYLTGTGLSQSPATNSVNENDVVTVSIYLSDNSGSANVQATLYYRIDGAAWTSGPMTYQGADLHDTTIPGQLGDTVVDYYVNATDAQDNWNTFADSYTVLGGVPPKEDPVFVPGTEGVHAPGDPGTQYNLTNPAPTNTAVAHSVTVDGADVTIAASYVVLVSVFDPIRDCFLQINSTVWVAPATTVDVTLDLVFSDTIITSQTLVTGTLYILTDLPSNGGETLTSVSFSYYVG